VIRTLASLGLTAGREDGLTGVWVGGAKVCAMGIKLSRWVSMHGLALNVSPRLDHFAHIVPCGIEDRRVTSLEELLPGAPPDLDTVRRLLLTHFCEVFGAAIETAKAEPSVLPSVLDAHVARSSFEVAPPTVLLPRAPSTA